MKTMTPNEKLAEALKGGPGLRGYAYRGAAYCIDCGQRIIRELPRIPHPASPFFSDSETLPQPIWWEEVDWCDECGSRPEDR